MSDIVAFIRARLDEDEQIARATLADNVTGEWEAQPAYGYLHEAVTDQFAGVRVATGPARVNAHIARHDPARVLREVEAKRRLIDGLVESMEGDFAPWNEDLLKLLALPDADHPDYDEAWRL